MTQSFSIPTLGPSAHIDTFCRDRLPPPEQWPGCCSSCPSCATAPG